MQEEVLPSLVYLWDKRTLYIGPLFEPLALSQGAATLIVALDKPILFTCHGMLEPIACRSLLLPAGFSVHVDTCDAIVANINLDALGADYYALAGLMCCDAEGIGYQLVDEEHFIDGFIALYKSDMDSVTAQAHLETILSKHEVAGLPPYTVDQRIVKVISLIKQTVDDNLSVDDLAKAVNLSVPRLVQLFKHQTGVPIRRYRLWHRLYVTAVNIGRGASLTDAAIEAGFTDSSHCSHTFRSMLGLKPSLILSQPNRVKIIVSNNALNDSSI